MKGEIGCVFDASTVTTEIVSPLVIPQIIMLGPIRTLQTIIKRKFIAHFSHSHPYLSNETLLGPVKISECIKDECDVNEGSEHHVEFFKA